MANLQPKGLTVSIIFDAMSLNYGEGVGNISELKKLSKGGELYSYESRQAIRYDIYRMLREYFGISETPVKEKKDKKRKETLQFDPEATIDKYPEIDLFGYLKTKGKEEREDDKESSIKRPAIVRITPAIALEPMNLDVEFGTNLNLAQRAGSTPDPFQFEHHSSLYTYTVTVELDRVGEDENDDIHLESEEKAKRVNMLLDVLKVLNRNIKGRMENLNPLFAIGGVYNVKNPFFLNRLKVEYNKESRKYKVLVKPIKSVLEMSFLGERVRDNTYVGIVEGYWDNEEEIKTLPVKGVSNIENFFENLKREVNDYYGV